MKYVCQNEKCGYTLQTMLSICPGCNQFNTIKAVGSGAKSKKAKQAEKLSSGVGGTHSRVQNYRDVVIKYEDRIDSGYGEFNRVLGGGILPGSIILLGGEPGMGKSTLLGATAGHLANTTGNVLYVSAEESATQVKGRLERIGVNTDNLYLVFETVVETIIHTHIPEIKPRIIIVDSITTITSTESSSASGTPSQVRACTEALQKLAKSTNTTVFAVSHVTKSGDVSGPNTLSHMVDAVLYLEGDQHGMFRLLRAQKNRFGAVGEVGVFSMQADGLQEVPNPSEAFLAERLLNKPGSAVTITIEGNRPLGLEIQALTIGEDKYNPARRTNGFDTNRLHMLSAVCDKFVKGINVSETDVFINVVGGMKITEPASDMSLIAALMSSYIGEPVPSDIIAIGEVGLTGEIRNVPQMELRLREANNLGFSKVIVPRQLQKIKIPKSIELVEVRTVEDALHVIYPNET